MTNHQRGRLARAVAGMSRILEASATLPLLGMLALGSSTAKAAVVQLKSAYPFQCADVSGGVITDGTPVIANYCYGGFNQQWLYGGGQFLGEGTTNVVAKCITISGAEPAPPGTAVQLHTCNGGANQQWEIISGASFGFPNTNLIYNRQDNLCLDGSGGLFQPLTVQLCNGLKNQNWMVH